MNKFKKSHIYTLVLMICVLVLALTGCKSYVPNYDFENLETTFGEQAYEGSDKKDITPIKVDDEIYAAIQKIDRNFVNYNYVASRGKVVGTTQGKIGNSDMKTEQTVYSTLIRQKDAKGYTIYHEDASTSNKPAVIKEVVVRVLQKLDLQGEGSSVVRVYQDADSTEQSYPKVAEGAVPKEDSFSAINDYINKYHQPLNALTVYDLSNTVDASKSTITETEDGFINVHIEVLSNSLQDATVNRRHMIAIKAGYNKIAQTTYDKVIFKKLSIDVKLWKTGYLRKLTIKESYDMTLNSGMTQKCDGFVSELYFSHDPHKLPIVEFEKQFTTEKDA